MEQILQDFERFRTTNVKMIREILVLILVLKCPNCRNLNQFELRRLIQYPKTFIISVSLVIASSFPIGHAVAGITCKAQLRIEGTVTL